MKRYFRKLNRSLPARVYKHKIFPHIEDVRFSSKLRTVLQHLAYKGIREYRGDPETIFEREEWDNCLIIDACRFDLYQEVFPEEDLQKRVSMASASAGYIEETYSSGDYSDVVYVSGNPHLGTEKFESLTGRKPNEVFHEVFQTWDTDWSKGEGRPSTEAVVRDAKTAKKLFPGKKLVVHFMKPHHPFTCFDFTGFNKELDGTYEQSVWAYAERGELSWSQVWRGYKKNLRDVMEDVRELAESLEGKTVLTSDHGNLCGENGMGHHPGGRRKEFCLREVPWVEL